MVMKSGKIIQVFWKNDIKVSNHNMVSLIYDISLCNNDKVYKELTNNNLNKG